MRLLRPEEGVAVATGCTIERAVGFGGGGVGNNFLTGLYAYWKMDESSSSAAAVDASGNGKDMSPFGGSNTILTNAGGVINGCRGNDGTNNGSLGGRATTDFQPVANPFALCGWFKLNNLSQSGNDTGLFSKANAAAEYEYISWFKSGAGDHKIRWGVSPDGAALTSVTWPTPVTANTWFFIAHGWDGTNIWLSVDGGTKVTTAFAGPVRVSSQSLFIGFEQGSAGLYNGFYDECAIWIGRDLSDSDVAKLYNGGAGLSYDAFQ